MHNTRNVCDILGFPVDSDSKESVLWETWVQSLGLEDPLEKGIITHSSILVWRLPNNPCRVTKAFYTMR